MFMRVFCISAVLSFGEFPITFRAIRQSKAKAFRFFQEARRIGCNRSTLAAGVLTWVLAFPRARFGWNRPHPVGSLLRVARLRRGSAEPSRPKCGSQKHLPVKLLGTRTASSAHYSSLTNALAGR